MGEGRHRGSRSGHRGAGLFKGSSTTTGRDLGDPSVARSSLPLRAGRGRAARPRRAAVGGTASGCWSPASATSSSATTAWASPSPTGWRARAAGASTWSTWHPGLGPRLRDAGGGYDAAVLWTRRRGEAPGTLYLIEPEVDATDRRHLDTHGMDPATVIAMVPTASAPSRRARSLSAASRPTAWTRTTEEFVVELSEPARAALSGGRTARRVAARRTCHDGRDGGTRMMKVALVAVGAAIVAGVAVQFPGYAGT